MAKDILSPDLEFYHRHDPFFPSDSTADQFYDEAQFEAYRSLGYNTGRQAFGEAFADPDIDDKTAFQLITMKTKLEAETSSTLEPSGR